VYCRLQPPETAEVERNGSVASYQLSEVLPRLLIVLHGSLSPSDQCDDGTGIEKKDKGGDEAFFDELERNADYVTLFDPGRRMFLRCYNDRAEIFEKGTWGLLCTGEWAKQ